MAMKKKTTSKKTAKPAPKKAKKTAAKSARAAAPESREPLEQVIVKAAMDLAAERGWNDISVQDVAELAGLEVEQVQELCPDKLDLLRMLGEEINIAMLEGGQVDGGLRDNLFELMMRRYEALLPYRAGIRAVVEASRRDPSLALRLAPDFHDALGHILDMAGSNPSMLNRLGLGVAVAAVFRVWLEDESEDLSATMAALDKRLGQLEQAAQILAPVLSRAA
jgi:AcrR family transcriptional regulator